MGVFREYCTKNDILIFTTNSKLKASIIERFNRTLKEKIWRIFTYQAEKQNKLPKNFTNFLQKIIENYNNSFHRAIKTAPNLVTNKNEAKIRNILYADLDEQINLKFKVGDYCKISVDKELFDKSYEPNWQNEIYIIANIFPSVPPRYTIKDLENSEYSYKFYDFEIQKVNNLQFPYNTFQIIKELNKKILVQQLNSSSEQIWLDKNEFLNN